MNLGWNVPLIPTMVMTGLSNHLKLNHICTPWTRHRVSFLKKREHDPVHDPGIPVTISCIVTDPMQLSRESFYEDYIILCIASFRITSHFEERGKGANSAFEYLDGQLGTHSLRQD